MNLHPLKNLHILVTRPTLQARGLIKQIEQLGGNAILFPTIEIVDIENTATINHYLNNLTEFNGAIFVSVNAVQKTAELMKKANYVWPKGLEVIAVGATTAHAIIKLNWPLAAAPEAEFNSEAVLALPLLQQVAAKKIILFCGEGGRELLADTLRQRGAEVVLAVVYRRIKPRAILEPHSNIDYIVCTSNQGLKNLIEMVKPENHLWLQNKQLVVISQRMVALAKELHFVKPPLIATNATDDAIIQILINWVGENTHGSNFINQ